jgi:hypothetical protein
MGSKLCKKSVKNQEKISVGKNLEVEIKLENICSALFEKSARGANFSRFSIRLYCLFMRF